MRLIDADAANIYLNSTGVDYIFDKIENVTLKEIDENKKD